MCTLNKILELVEKNNIKQKDLTDYLGISKNAFTNWKGGYSQSYYRYLPQIAEFFNVSIDYLAGREESSQQTIKNQVDDFTYAMYDEAIKDLTDEEKKLLLDHVRMFRKIIGK